MVCCVNRINRDPGLSLMRVLALIPERGQYRYNRIHCQVAKSAVNAIQRDSNRTTLRQLMYIEVKHPTKGDGRDARHWKPS